jgi:hypothetical protein
MQVHELPDYEFPIYTEMQISRQVSELHLLYFESAHVRITVCCSTNTPLVRGIQQN